MKCDACGTEANLRLVGELLGPHIRQACRNCVGPGIGWFYMRRPGNFDAMHGPMVPWELKCQKEVCTAPECYCPAVADDR